MSERERLRARAHGVLRHETWADAVLRLCVRCGSPEHGAPYARMPGGTTRPAPSVSLSYAGELAVVAWGWSGPVGVDVERDGAPVDGVGDRADWTRHEALAKASGLGLAAVELPDLPTRALDLPAGYVGTLAGVGAAWRLVR